MRKQTILKYEKEFMAWCKGEPVLVGFPASMADSAKNILTWRQVQDFKDWDALDTKYVLDNEYSQFSKALAEGKTVEYLYTTIPEKWDELTEQKFRTIPLENLRIKPDAPKFKVGDFVTEIHSKHASIVLEIFGDNIRIRASNMHTYTAPMKDFEHWKPQPKEWCVFWNANQTRSARISQFKQVSHAFGVEAQYRDQQGQYFDYCEPFIGEVPTYLKD